MLTAGQCKSGSSLKRIEKNQNFFCRITYPKSTKILLIYEQKHSQDIQSDMGENINLSRLESLIVH